jgi:hypothetical protein
MGLTSPERSTFYAIQNRASRINEPEIFRTSIAHGRVDQGLQNRRAPVANGGFGRHCGRRPLRELPIQGRWFHVRLSSNNGLLPDIAACRLCADFVAEVGCGRWVAGHLVSFDRL